MEGERDGGEAGSHRAGQAGGRPRGSGSGSGPNNNSARAGGGGGGGPSAGAGQDWRRRVGRFPRPRGLEERDGGRGAPGVGRALTGRPRGERLDWATRGQGRPRIGRGGTRGRGQRARGSEREREGAGGWRARRGRAEARGAGGSPAPPQLLSGPEHRPSLPGPRSVRVPGAGSEGRHEGGRGRRTPSKRRVPRRPRRRLARCSGPGRPHYAGGLPAAAMASRAAVRAGRRPHRRGARAASPASRPRARPRHCSSSFPMPLLLLLLLLDDAGAQQGERARGAGRWARPGCAGRDARAGAARVGSACWPPGWRGVTFWQGPSFSRKERRETLQ